jgi:hypothetical protein
MKKSDIAMIILIASISVLIAYFVAKSIFGDVYSGTAKVKTIEKISETVVEPSKEIFNSSAINPSVKVQIKNTGNQ